MMRRMSARSVLLLLASAIALLGAGCAPNETSASRGVATPAGGKRLKVALLTPGPVSDAGWSAIAYRGLLAIRRELGAEIANQEASGAKIKDAMRTYAQQGYDLVFGHGFEYNEFGVQVAKDFPNTVFVSSSGGKTAPNAGAFRFYLEQGFYLAGVMAGKMTKSNVLGAVAVQDYPSIVSTLKAFEAGARAANPKVRVITAYFGTEGDVAKAKQATEQVIAQGADFVIHQANAAAQGVFDAAKERGIYAFGANADQNDNPSGVVIASAVIVAEPAFLNLARQVRDGTYRGSVQLFGMKDGAIDFVANPALANKIPPDVAKLLDATKSKIRSGALVVPKDEF